MDVSTKHIRVAYLYIGKERGFFTEGIDLKLALVPAYLAGTALIARQLDSMEFGSMGTIAGTGIQRLVDRGMGLDKQMLHPAMHRPVMAGGGGDRRDPTHLPLSLSSANKKPGWRNRVRAIDWKHGCTRSTQLREANR